MPFLKIEIKRMLHAIPKFLGMALILLVIVSAIAFGASTLIENENNSKIRMALTMPPTDENIGGVVLSALEGMDSVRNAMEVIYADEKAGDEMLKNGEVSVHVIVPDGFLNGVMYGENIPAAVKLKDGSSFECMLTVNGLDSASEMLKISQSGVFAAFYGANEVCGEKIDTDALLYDANMCFIELIFSRNDLFKIKNAAMTGDITTEEFIASSCVVLIFLLVSTAAMGMFQRENADYYKRLSSLNIKGIGITLAKFISVSLLILSAAIIISAVLAASSLVYDAKTLFALIPVILLCSAFAVFIMAAANNKMASVIIFFMLSIVLMFASGGIMPDAFLPNGIIEFASYLPIFSMLETVRGILSGSGEYMIWQCFVHTAILLVLACLCYFVRLRRGRA